MSRRPAPTLYRRLTHKPWASYGHALGLLDWRFVIRMTVWEPQDNLELVLLFQDLLVVSRGLSDQSG